jgi:hypothetical protein
MSFSRARRLAAVLCLATGMVADAAWAAAPDGGDALGGPASAAPIRVPPLVGSASRETGPAFGGSCAVSGVPSVLPRLRRGQSGFQPDWGRLKAAPTTRFTAAPAPRREAAATNRGSASRVSLTNLLQSWGAPSGGPGSSFQPGATTQSGRIVVAARDALCCLARWSSSRGPRAHPSTMASR